MVKCQASEDGGNTWADLTQIMTGAGNLDSLYSVHSFQLDAQWFGFSETASYSSKQGSDSRVLKSTHPSVAYSRLFFFLHSLMAKSRSCPRMKLSRFIFMLGTLHKNLKEEHDSKHACKSFFSAPANQGLGRYKKYIYIYIYVYIWSRPLSLHPPREGGVAGPGAYIQLQIYGQYQHDESYTKRSKKCYEFLELEKESRSKRHQQNMTIHYPNITVKPVKQCQEREGTCPIYPYIDSGF